MTNEMTVLIVLVALGAYILISRPKGATVVTGLVGRPAPSAGAIMAGGSFGFGTSQNCGSPGEMPGMGVVCCRGEADGHCL